MGKEIDCGHALVGQIKACRFIVENEGGDGRFALFGKSSWPSATFKTNLVAPTLGLHPFELQPSLFDLRKGEAFVLECVFKPPDDRRYEQDLVIVCENCTTLEVKLVGQGQLARVEYIELEQQQQNNENAPACMGSDTVGVDEFKDVSSSKIVRFVNLNPNVYERKKFAIRNMS